MMKKNCLLSVFIVFAFGTFAQKSDAESDKLKTVSYAELETGGELRTRILKNFDRLEETKYQPANVFLTDKQSGNWPGDTEGRTILALVLDARSSHREPKYLKEIIDLIPQKLNSKGYMGQIFPAGTMDEQQLSGNGWMLRGLCEYYAWKKDEKVLKIVKSIIKNLFIPGKGYYKIYPIDPKDRNLKIGEAMGTIDRKVGNWMLSTDIGCLFIGMDGAIQALQYIPDKELKVVIDEMVLRFLQIDLVAIKAQTHATLTALRGLLRYAEMTGKKELVGEASKRWELYKSFGMTENYANYNWFTRYEASTEPCAIVDAYMVAAQLWISTRDPQYLPYLDLIYYNAICHGQRENGGFGCDKFLSPNINTIIVSIPEAHWCCTMRGGEGLSKVAEYSYFTNQNSLYVVHFVDGKVKASFSKDVFMTMVQKTQYPFSGAVNLTIAEAKNAKTIAIRLNALTQWTENSKTFINGVEVPVVIQNGFITLTHDWKPNDEIKYVFENKIHLEKPLNKVHYSDQLNKVLCGPLLLGYPGKETAQIGSVSQIKQISPTRFGVKNTNVELSPLYHLMSKEVVKGDGYKKQILFKF